jgi:NADPH-dependent 2,4-dienoyl-CoA reductase/sulfur reductase-like enzyme
MSYDIVVIGGGPGGIAAARSAAQKGARVALLERDEELGGILPQCIHHGFGLTRFKEELTGPEYATREEELLLKEKVDIFLNTTVVSLSSSEVEAISPRGKEKFETRAVVLAMGSRERTAPAIGLGSARPAGIFTAGAAQRLVNMEGCLPGRRAVIVGSGDIGLIMARRLSLEGVKVEAVVEIMPYPGGLLRNRVQCLDDFKIPLLLSHKVIAVHGKKRVERITIGKLDSDGKIVEGTERDLSCDCLLLSVGLIPENELSKKAGIKLDPVTGGPVVDQDFETSVPGIFACGNVVAISDLADDVTAQGERAGERAARSLSSQDGKSGVELKRGPGIHSVVPQVLTKAEATKIAIRVARPMEQAELHCGDVCTFKLKNLKPAQMLSLMLAKEQVEGLLAADGATLRLEEKK